MPGKGFPTHPHEEMEILTVVLDGEITHQDSMGNKAVIRAGDVQRMSAGTGLTHSEFNLAGRPVHFCQIWIFPDQKGLKPSYDQRTFEPAQWKNCLLPVASGQGLPETVSFHTAATVYRSDLEKGKHVAHSASALRRVFLYLTEGQIEINGTVLNESDQARVDEEDELLIRALRDSSFVLIDVPSCKGYGYSGATLKGARA
jgi:hypothetical protein